MDALISGRAGIALLSDGQSLVSFDIGEADKFAPRRQEDLRFLFGEAGDIRQIEDTDPLSAAEELQRDYDCVCALDLALMTLDAELSEETRRETAEALDELLSDRFAHDYLESILYAKPLPAMADLTGVMSYCDGNQMSRLKDFWQRLAEQQAAIGEVRRAWDQLPVQLFGSYQQRQRFHQTAISEGLFRDLVRAYPEANRIGMFFVEALQKLPNHRSVLQQWVQPFHEKQKGRGTAPHSEIPDAKSSNPAELIKMATTSIDNQIKELRQQREQLAKMVPGVAGAAAPRRGRPQGSTSKASASASKKPKRVVSAATRKKLKEAAKARWAKIRQEKGE